MSVLDYVYFDNNGSAIMPPEAIQELANWCNRGNPSASHKPARDCAKLMTEMTKYILGMCNTTPNIYELIYTSGATESNSTIIRASVNSWLVYKRSTPHIIISSIEHKSILLLCEQMESQKYIELSKIAPSIDGIINPEHVREAIRPNTCIISIMAANNEIGSINNIDAISAIARSNGIPFHCDAVQTFGKYPPNLNKTPLACISLSFHKYGGPPGIGALIVRKDFHSGYKLCSIICGTQNFGFRGGTENIIGIASSYRAMKIYWNNRNEKNSRLLALKVQFARGIAAILPVVSYREYHGAPDATLKKYAKAPAVVVFISECINSNRFNQYLVNTCLFSIIAKNTDLCNAKIKSLLEDKKIIVSVGSACNTGNKYASHVLDAIGADNTIKRGTLRISFGDQNTAPEVNYIIEAFADIFGIKTK